MVLVRYRKTGYATCFALCFLAVWISLYMLRDVIKGPHLLQVHFPNVGTLIPEEPVSMDGVEIGRVANIDYTPGAALVTLEFYKRIKLPIDSKIINFNHSMMGSRMVFVERGSSRQFMNMREIQSGIFEPGIAEMLYKANVLLEKVNHYHRLVQELSGVSPEGRSLLETYQSVLLPLLRQYTQFITELTGTMDRVTESIRRTEAHTVTVRNFIRDLNARHGPMLERTIEFFKLVNKGLEDLQQTTESAHKKVSDLNRPGTIFYEVTYKKDLFKKLEQVNESMNTFVKILKADGVEDIISFWKNVHIMGRNPTSKNSKVPKSPK